MDEETEAQRRARQDGTQLAFAAVLRELVRSAFPNEQIRAGRRDKVKRAIDAAANVADVDSHDRDALRAASATVDSIFLPGKS